MKRALLALSLAVSAPVFGADKSKPIDTSKMPPPVNRKVDFVKEVYPILDEACINCHGPVKSKGKYRCDTKEGTFKVTDWGPAIVPGHSDQSVFIQMCCNLIDEMMMPPPSDKKGEGEPLTKEQIGILRAWIDQGANWPAEPFEKYVKPVTFAADIQPIFATACASCHKGAEAKGGFDATEVAAVLKGGSTYGKVVTPGDIKKSSLVTIVAGLDEDLPQPEKHKLQAKQVELVKKWILQGAK